MIAQNARPRRALLGLAAALTLFTGFAAAAPAQAKIELRIRLEPKVLRPDGLATLTIQATGDEIGSLGFTPSFSLDNLEIVSGPHRFEETSWDGRGLSRTFRLSWTLRPLGPGRAGVREGRLAIRGRRIVLEDREIQVAVDAPPPEGSVDPLAPGVPDPLHLLDRLLRGRPTDPRAPEATDASAAPPVFLRAEITSQDGSRTVHIQTASTYERRPETK